MEEMREDAVKLLTELLELPSVNSRDDEGAMAEYLSSYFDAHGIENQVQRIDAAHGNVTAWMEGEDRSRTILLNGHLDTVPYGELERWKTDPAKAVQKDGRIYARGASDMKSGLAAMVYAMTHLKDKPRTNIQFIGTCDEERSGLGAQMILKEAFLMDCDFWLIGEPTDLKLGMAHKGCLWLKLIVRGKTGHGAYPEKGVNAILYMYRIAEDIKNYVYGFYHPLLGTATAQIDMIQGGIAPNMTADLCEAVMDIRMVPGLTTEMIIARGTEAVEALKKEAPELSVEFHGINNRRAFEIDGEEAHVKNLRDLLVTYGYTGEEIGINYFTDASVLAEKDYTRNVLLFGPGNPAMAHQPDEYVEVSKYLDAIGILKDLFLN